MNNLIKHHNGASWLLRILGCSTIWHCSFEGAPTYSRGSYNYPMKLIYKQRRLFYIKLKKIYT